MDHNIEEAAKRRRSLDAIRQRIGLFAFQNGVPFDRIPEFIKAAASESSLLTEKAELDHVERAYFQRAVELVAEDDSHVQEDFRQHFPFEEDAEMHSGLLTLPLEERIVFVLAYFHGKDPKKSERFSDWSYEKIDAHIAQARSGLVEGLALDDEDVLNERLRLLGKSYSRLSFEFPEEEEEQMQEERLEEETTSGSADVPASRRMPKKTAALLAAAFIGIGGIVGSSFFFGDETDSGSAVEDPENYVPDSQIEEWKAEYVEIRDRGPELLGLPDERYEELRYVKTANAAYDEFFSEASLGEVRSKPQEMEKRVRDLMILIETPGGMSNNRYIEDLITDEKEEYIYLFAMKTQELMDIANSMFREYEDELAQASRDGALSTDELLQNLDQYPEELAALLARPHETALRVVVHPEQPLFLARRDVQSLQFLPQLTSEWARSIYMEVLAEEPFLDNTGLLVPEEAMPMLLTYMEMMLLEEQLGEPYLNELEVWIEQLFWFALKSPPLYTEDGMIHETKKRLWTDLLQYSQGSLYYVLQPIVTEMQDSGWRESAAFDQLAYSDITRAIDMKKSGELDALMPFAEHAIENRFIDMNGFEWDETASLYGRFSEDYDPEVLKGLDPLDIYLLYRYADSQEDAVAMWNLLEDDAARPERDMFVSGWQALPPLEEEVRWLELMEGSEMRMADSMAVMPQLNYVVEEVYWRPGPTFVIGHEGIWKLKYQWEEIHELDGSGSAYEDQVKSIYSRFAAEGDMSILNGLEPSIVGGVYLHAGVVKDVETMKRMLADQPDSSEVPEEEMDSFLLRLAPTSLDNAERIIFRNDMTFMEDEALSGTIEIQTSPEGGSSLNGFGMILTENGWRMDIRYW